MSQGRYAWLRTQHGQMQIMRYEQTPFDEIGENIVLFIPRANARPIRQNFTSLTLEELQATREFYTILFDLAEPICRERDKAAQDAFDNESDDSFLRLYRQAPQLVIREGAIAPYTEGLQGGPEDVPAGPPSGVSDGGGVRGDGDELVDPEPEDRSPEDDLSQAN